MWARKKPAHIPREADHHVELHELIAVSQHVLQVDRLLVGTAGARREVDLALTRHAGQLPHNALVPGGIGPIVGVPAR